MSDKKRDDLTVDDDSTAQVEPSKTLADAERRQNYLDQAEVTDQDTGIHGDSASRAGRGLHAPSARPILKPKPEATKRKLTPAEKKAEREKMEAFAKKLDAATDSAEYSAQNRARAQATAKPQMPGKRVRPSPSATPGGGSRNKEGDNR